MARAVALQNLPHIRHNQCQEFEHIRHYCTQRLLAVLQSTHVSMDGKLAETAAFLQKLGILKPSLQTAKHVLAFVLFAAEGAAGARHDVMAMVEWGRKLRALVKSPCGDTRTFGLWTYPETPAEMQRIDPDLYHRAFFGEVLVETGFDHSVLNMVTGRTRVKPGNAAAQTHPSSTQGGAAPAEAAPVARAQAVPPAVPKISGRALGNLCSHGARAPSLRSLEGAAEPARGGAATPVVDLLSDDELPSKRIKQERQEAAAPSPPAPQPRMTVEDMEAQMRAAMGETTRRRKAGSSGGSAVRKRPAARQPPVSKRPAALRLPPGVDAGCSKCRGVSNGCAHCLRDVIHQLVQERAVD